MTSFDFDCSLDEGDLLNAACLNGTCGCGSSGCKVQDAVLVSRAARAQRNCPSHEFSGEDINGDTICVFCAALEPGQ